MSSQKFFGGITVGAVGGVGLALALVRGTAYPTPEVTVLDNNLTQYQARFNEIMRYGVSADSKLCKFENHALQYCNERRTPRWVAEHLTKANLVKGEAVHRKNSSFTADLNLDDRFQAAPEEYYKTGWSRGHMAPAADARQSQAAMDQTFLLSNIVPQDRDNNEKYWANLESFCRHLTDVFDDVYIISGPLYLPHTRPDGKRFVEYEVIGKSNIAVPTHLFKIVVAVRSGQQPTLGAFVVPNAPIPQTTPLTTFQVTLEYVETAAGHLFLPELDRQKVKDLCLVQECKLYSYEAKQLEYVVKKLSKAKTVQEADEIWKSFSKRNVKADSSTTAHYNNVRNALDSREKRNG